MLKRPLLVVVALLHIVGIFVLGCLDNHQFGERLADNMGLGFETVTSRLGTQLLGRPFSDRNLIAEMPSFLMASLAMSQVGLFAILLCFGCNSGSARRKVAIAGLLWTPCVFLLLPVIIYGDSFYIWECLTWIGMLTIQFVGVCVIVSLFGWSASRNDKSLRLGDRFSLRQLMVFVTCVATGLGMKGAHVLVAHTVSFTLITGMAACLAVWSWSPLKLYRIVFGALAVCVLGIVPFFTIGDMMAREAGVWFVFSLSIAVAMAASGALLGRNGRREMGLA